MTESDCFECCHTKQEVILLMSRFLPQVFPKSKKKRKTIADDREMIPSADKGKLCQCKVIKHADLQ